MPKHRYLPLAEDLGLPPALREALNHNGQAVEEEFEDVRGSVIELRADVMNLSAVLETLSEKIGPVHELFTQSVMVMHRLTEQSRRLVDQVVAEREEYRRRESPFEQAQAAFALPPARDKLPTYDDIKRAVAEGVEQGTGRFREMTSDRVREVTDERIDKSRDKEDAETLRDLKKGARKIAWEGARKVLGALSLLAAGWIFHEVQSCASLPKPTPIQAPR